MGKHYSKAPCQAFFFSLAPQGAWKGKRKRKGREENMSRFTGSSRAMACRETGLCRYGRLKVVLLLESGMGYGGVEVQRKHKEVRGSWGTGNNEEESLIHFLGLAFGP